MVCLTRKRFLKQLKRNPGYLAERWDYYSAVINVLRRSGWESCLEVGPAFLPLVGDADLMDKYNQCKEPIKYQWDIMETPWPIQDKEYDVVIALQVWEHLKDKQREAFAEVMRVSCNAILSFPWKWKPGGKKSRSSSKHWRINAEKINEWTLGVKPVETMLITTPRVRRRMIYVFEF